MFLDHIAYRVKNKEATAKFFTDAFGYTIQEPFVIYFDDGTYADCVALEHDTLPEIFISDGSGGSIVDAWVKEHGPGIHHIAYRVDSVADVMKEWKEKGYAEFTSDEPLTCPDLTQVFTKPSELTGIIYEFIERGDRGFCKDNVKGLMESTKGL